MDLKAISVMICQTQGLTLYSQDQAGVPFTNMDSL